MIHVIRKMIKVSINFRVFIILRYYILFTIYYLSYHSANLFRIFSRQFPQMSHDLELQTSWTISNLLQNTSLRKSLVYRNNWIKIFIINSTIKILLYFKLIKFETQINSSQNISRSIFFYKKKKKSFACCDRHFLFMLSNYKERKTPSKIVISHIISTTGYWNSFYLFMTYNSAR